MATADAFRSSTTRGVSLRRRGDLVVNRQVYQGQAWWVVKDPISLHYFRFRPEEYALLEMLDGKASLDDLKERSRHGFRRGGSRSRNWPGSSPRCTARAS